MRILLKEDIVAIIKPIFELGLFKTKNNPTYAQIRLIRGPIMKNKAEGHPDEMGSIAQVLFKPKMYFPPSKVPIAQCPNS
ncbi:MAG: hypothetical protein GF308_14080 [Candidatus Heimdallarchaeota archaeon]|nr:hypothetical protein [Candidatus Heimdallarchaeota archaeon]